MSFYDMDPRNNGWRNELSAALMGVLLGLVVLHFLGMFP